jgi:hypothetical protein
LASTFFPLVVEVYFVYGREKPLQRKKMKMSQAISLFGMSDAAMVLDGLRAQLGPGSFPEKEEVPAAPQAKKARPAASTLKGPFHPVTSSKAPGYETLGLLGALRSLPEGGKELRLLYTANSQGKAVKAPLGTLKAELAPGETLVEGVALKGPGVAGTAFGPVGGRMGTLVKAIPALSAESDVRAAGKLGRFFGLWLEAGQPAAVPQPQAPAKVLDLVAEDLARMPAPRRLLVGDLQAQALRRAEATVATA